MAKLRKQPRSPSAVAGHHAICCCVWYWDDSIVCLNELKNMRHHETERAWGVTGHDWNQKNCGQESVDLSQTVECWNLFFAPLVKAPRIGFAIRAEVEQQLLDFRSQHNFSADASCTVCTCSHISFYMFTHWFTPSPSVTQIRENTIEYNFQPLCFARSDAHSSHRQVLWLSGNLWCMLRRRCRGLCLRFGWCYLDWGLLSDPAAGIGSTTRGKDVIRDIQGHDIYIYIYNDILYIILYI